jgi:hypothetical protein
MPPIKSAIAWPSGKAYLFDDTNYLRYDFERGMQDQTAQPIVPAWSGLRSTAPDAGVYWGFGKVYFFYGDEYVRFDIDNDAVEPDYLPPNPPVKIAGNWPGLWTDHIDAAVNWGNGKIFFFRGSQYIRYDITLDRADPGYPKDITEWNGIWPDNLDAVLYQGGQKAYFFKGDEYRRYDVNSDSVDETGLISSLTLDPVPSGMVTSSRDLTLDQANKVMGYLIQNGKFSLSPTQTPYNGDWQTGITSPQPTVHVVVKPATINGIDFLFQSNSSATLIDNLDQRMLVNLYRLTRWLNASEPDVTVIRHLGIGHGSGPSNDCHNQGRANDFFGVDGTFQGAPFDRNILRDWGNKPVISGVAMRLNPTVDQLAHDLFRTAFRFGTFECECNGIGAANKWPPKEIGDVGGFVIHPDYIDSPGEHLRQAHQNHIHMQIGPTRV